MPKFVKVEMTDKTAYPKPVPINFDFVISLTPHLTEANRYMLVLDGSRHDVIIPARAMAALTLLDTTDPEYKDG